MIFDPLGQTFVLAGVAASAMSVVLGHRPQVQARINQAGVLRIAALALLLAAVLYLWRSVPQLLLPGALLFVPAALIARPEGPAQCASFACAFLLAGLAGPLAGTSATGWVAAMAVVAAVVLAACLIHRRIEQASAIAGAAAWSMFQFLPIPNT